MSAELTLGRRERNKLRNREDILGAALDAFSENGFHDTSIQDIALRAEFAVGTIYALFDTKEDIYRALLVEYAEQAAHVFGDALETGDDEYERLMNYVEAKGRLFEHKMKLARLILTETMGTGISFRHGPKPELKSMYSVWHHRLAEIFQEGMKAGVFRECDAFALAISLEGTTNAFIYHWQESPESWPYERCVEHLRENFFRPLLRDASTRLTTEKN